MVISETTVRTTDGAVEHPRMDLLCVVEQMPWFAYQLAFKELSSKFDPLHQSYQIHALHSFCP
jgi:hypothetical protein